MKDKKIKSLIKTLTEEGKLAGYRSQARHPWYEWDLGNSEGMENGIGLNWDRGGLPIISGSFVISIYFFRKRRGSQLTHLLVEIPPRDRNVMEAVGSEPQQPSRPNWKQPWTARGPIFSLYLFRWLLLLSSYLLAVTSPTANFLSVLQIYPPNLTRSQPQPVPSPSNLLRDQAKWRENGEK